MTNLEWTEETPKKAGEYLCCIDGDQLLVAHLKIKIDSGSLWTPDIGPATGTFIDTLEDDERTFHWAGPIPRPSDQDT